MHRFSKEMFFAFCGVTAFHILLYSLVDMKENNQTGKAKQKTISLAVSYEDESEGLPREPTSELMAKALIVDAFGNRSLLRVNNAALSTANVLFDEVAPPIQEWLDAFSKDDLLFKSAPRYYPEVECRLIGANADLLGIDNSPLKAWDEKAFRYKCVYEIGIEGKSGKVVYARLIDEETPLDIAIKAERHLSSIKFPKSKQPIIKSMAEIIVTKEQL